MSALLLTLALAHAEDPAPTPAPAPPIAASGTQLSTTGELREMLTVGSDFAVDALGTTVGQGPHLDQRLRAGFAAKGAKYRFVTEWDLMTGQLAGDVWDIPTAGDERRRDIHGALTLDAVQPRKLSVGMRGGKVDVEAGLQTSHWGLGLLANDGDHEPLFGREDFGDRVLRVKAVTSPFGAADGKPAPTFVLVATDLVYADELARLVDGQVALQGIAALLHDEGPGMPKMGVYTVYRHQYEKGLDRLTQAGAIDGFVYQPVGLTDALRLELGVEAVGILGRTDRAVTYAGRDGLGVLNAGVAAQTALRHDRFDVHANFGWTSGDGLPDDDHSSTFTADRDYNVGLVLFDEVIGNIDAGTHRLLTDGKYAGQPPDGVELVATEGAIHAAAWLQPAIMVRPLPALELRTGAVLAFSTAPIAQPFYSFRNGGVPTNHLDQPTDGLRSLGTELDWAVSYKLGAGEVPWRVRPRLEIQGGHALVGEALGGGTVTLVQSALRVDW